MIQQYLTGPCILLDSSDHVLVLSWVGFFLGLVLSGFLEMFDTWHNAV